MFTLKFKAAAIRTGQIIQLKSRLPAHDQQHPVCPFRWNCFVGVFFTTCLIQLLKQKKKSTFLYFKRATFTHEVSDKLKTTIFRYIKHGLEIPDFSNGNYFSFCQWVKTKILRITSVSHCCYYKSTTRDLQHTVLKQAFLKLNLILAAYTFPKVF